MNYELLLYEILNVGESMVMCGAEDSRTEDSLERICASYGFLEYDIFVIKSNIQATVRLPDKSFITQIRRIRGAGFDYDKLDYLNNLSRYICANTPEPSVIREKHKEVMSRKAQPLYLNILAAILGGAGFGVYFGCDFVDCIIAAFVCGIIIVGVGKILERKHRGLVVFNVVLSFLSSVIVIYLGDCGIGHHPDRIILGVMMVLISGLGFTNGIRDLFKHDVLSGLTNMLNALLGAIAIASGTGFAMILLKGHMYEMYISPSILIQLITCGIGTVGFALCFRASLRQSIYAGIGGLFTYTFYLIGVYFTGSPFAGTIFGAMSVAFYSYFMTRMHKAPATIFLTTSIMPVIPGATLFYMMYGFVRNDYALASSQALKLIQTCIAICFGFLIVEVIMNDLINFKNDVRTARRQRK